MSRHTTLADRFHRSGTTVIDVDGALHRFTCSDGAGPVSFGDLVVELTITADPATDASGTVGAS